jgi:hypothetical protein
VSGIEGMGWKDRCRGVKGEHSGMGKDDKEFRIEMKGVEPMAEEITGGMKRQKKLCRKKWGRKEI